MYVHFTHISLCIYVGQQVKCYLKIFCFHPETRNILASENLLAPPVLRNDSMVEVCREIHWDSAHVFTPG